MFDVSNSTPVIPQQSPQTPLIYDPRQVIRFSVNRRDNYLAYNAWKTKFKDRLHRTTLKDETLEADLTADNYQDKFYNLLCFEEMEHINLLTKR